MVVLGLDAAEATALAAGPDDHRFPHLAGLWRRGAHLRVLGLHDSLPDTVWAELRSGRSSIRTGAHAAIQFASGERSPRPRTVADLEPERCYWNVAADAGLRVAAVDQPLAPPHQGGSAHEISGWGTHEKPFGTVIDPTLATLVAGVESHPVGSCYTFNRGTVRSRRRLMTRLERGVDLHTDLFTTVLRSRTWDLFTAVYSETHCAGHHFWPPTPGAAGEADGSRPGVRAIESIHRRVDGAVGAILAVAPPGATVIVYTSHGMAPIDGGTLLLAEVLERIGLLPDTRRRRRASAAIPQPVRRLIRRIVGGETLRRAGLTLDRDLGDGATRAVALPNPRFGAIRLALAGRDPGAALVPGSGEHAALVATIEQALLDLRHLPSGEPIVTAVVPTDEMFGTDRHPDLPDLIVRFRTDLGLITHCTSPRTGDVVVHRRNHRTGDHGPPGALWMAGPGIPAGADWGAMRTIDLAPTVLATLGVPVPTWMDGRDVRGPRIGGGEGI